MARKTKVARRATKPAATGDRIKGSVLAALLTSTEFQERLQAAQQQCRDEWQALTGEPQPETCDQWREAAHEFLPRDVAHHETFTENDVALAMRGEMKRHRRTMAEAPVMPAPQAEPSGDNREVIARTLPPRQQQAMLALERLRSNHSCVRAEDIADAIRLRCLRDYRRRIQKPLVKSGLIEKRDGAGWDFTYEGRNVLPHLHGKPLAVVREESPEGGRRVGA